MTTSFAAFMGGLIDYAGLFPPASLDVPTAVAEYAAHRAEPEAWMLGRFIAPAAGLGDIAEASSEYLEGGDRWSFSVLAGHRDDPAQALAVLADQGRAVGAFEDRFAGAARVEVLEIPLPAAAITGLSGFLSDLAAHLRAADLAERQLFLEVPAGVDDRAALEALASFASLQAGPGRPFPLIGAKLRCGGVTAETFPSVERVAAFIHDCGRLDLPLKCTAGLHHPVRHRATEPDVMMHGFLNVFGAGLLAHAERSPLEVLTGCVGETDPAAFTFSPDEFAWRDHSVTVGDMRNSRGVFLNGFGSCSFREPKEDLRALGLL